MKKIKFAAAVLALLFVVTSAFTNKKAFTTKVYGLISRTTSGTNYIFTFADKSLVSQNQNLIEACNSTGNGCNYSLDFAVISGETVGNLVRGSETVVNGQVTWTVPISSAPAPDADGSQTKQYSVTD